MSKTNFEVHMKHLKVLMMKFYLFWHNSSELWYLFSRVPMGNCFIWCYFRQLFLSLAFRKCKKDCNILKIILVQGFCPLKTEVDRFPIGFRLKSICWDDTSFCMSISEACTATKLICLQTKTSAIPVVWAC